ncbi:MAG: hypothetical protein JNK14_00560 [Chitinophagaceae bacterium]|nr:hypothetical protein [Chitinophagaceae bacterium]
MKMLNFDSLTNQPLVEFNISTKEEAIQFEKHLHAIFDNNIDCPGKILFGLENIFEVCHKFKEEYGSRVFTAILDLAISQTNCACELDDCVKAWNNYFSNTNEYGNTPQSSVLGSEKFFEGKFYYQRHLNSFVFKYRAHWDKIMGLYFLVWKYDLYQDFKRARSRKKMFLKQFEGHQMIDQKIIDYVKNDLTLFDDSFRTHEAHSTGKLRKFAFTNGLEDSKNLLDHLVNEIYGNYVRLAPTIFQCIEYLLCFPEVAERLKNNGKIT